LTASLKKLITSFFFVGYIPLIPGTFASLVGLFIYILLVKNLYILFFAHLIIVVLGFFLTGSVARAFNHRDPPQIVIDEVNGMLISFIGLPILYLGRGGLILAIGFIVFRLFDIIKPYPINRLEQIKGSLGIMGDDIVAGIYTNLILRLILSF